MFCFIFGCWYGLHVRFFKKFAGISEDSYDQILVLILSVVDLAILGSFIFHLILKAIHL